MEIDEYFEGINKHAEKIVKKIIKDINKLDDEEKEDTVAAVIEILNKNYSVDE